jgi:type I restriction enzyme S subunit
MATLQPKLRFPDFKGDWEERKLGNISIKVNSGKTPLGGEKVYTDNGILFIRSQNINNDKLDLTNIVFVPEEINNTMKNSVVLANDILLNITGASLGRSCVVPNYFTIGNVNQHVCIIRLKSKYNPYFIQPIFSSKKGQDIFVSFQTGSGREGLNFDSIKRIELFFPNIEEQNKIANFLTSVDGKLNLLKEKKSLLEEYKKGIMQKIFNQELRFKDDNGNDFEDWEEKSLGEIAEIKRGAASQHLNYVNNSSDGIRLLRINDFLSDEAVYVENTKEIQRFKVKTGDLLIAGTGATAGIIFTVPEKFNNLPFSYNAPRIKILNDYNKFIYYYLKSDLILIQQKKLFVGNAQPFLDTNAMRGFRINLPSLKEQTKIANFLSAIDGKIDLVSVQIEEMQEYKKGLLQQMFV